MSVQNPARSLASAMIALLLATAFSVVGYSQDTRPRYSSRQSNERSWTIPADTIISMRMDNYLSSRTARVGDTFTATVTIPVYVNGRTVIPAGSVVEGRVTQVTPAKRMSKSGTIGIDFDELVFPNGERVQLVGVLTSDDPDMRGKVDEEGRMSGDTENRTAVFVGGGGAVGAVLGGMAGGGKGAVLGGIAGAGAGVAGVLLSKGEEAQVPSGTPFGIQLRHPLVIRESFVREGGTRAIQADDRDYDRDNADPRGGSNNGRDYDRNNDRDYDRDNVPLPAEASRPDRDYERREYETRPAEASRPAEPAEPPLPLSSPEMVKRAQIALKEEGYYEGQIDGNMGPRTATAIRTYQREHNLPETGDLDPETARSLKIIGGASAARSIPAADPRPARTSETRPYEGRPAEPRAPASSTVAATVLSATAVRNANGSISVTIDTQANTGGWHWFGEHVVNGDTLEVYARAERPEGLATQAITRGRIEMNIRDGVQYVRRVVVHSATGELTVPLRSGSAGPPANASSIPSSSPSVGPSAGMSIQRQAEELLSEYQRMAGIRMTGTGVELDSRSQNRGPEIELLFAIDNFANAAQLYARLVPSLQDRDSLRSATLSLAQQARRTDIVFTSTASRLAGSLGVRWDAIRQDVLRLMDSYNITASELEN